MATILAGIDGKAYILSTGSRATWGTLDADTGVHSGAAPTGLTEVDIIRNADLGITDGEGDGSRRKSKFKLYIPTQIDAGVDLEIPWDPTDANFIKLRNAKFARKSVAMAFLDGDKATVGAQGLWADFGVFDFSRSENIDKEMVAKVTLKPTPSAVAPEWVQVTGGGGGG